MAEQLARFLFVLYCTAAGLILLLAPWTPRWDLVVSHLPLSDPHFLTLALARGLISGFGLVHLVWGFHDLAIFVRPNER